MTLHDMAGSLGSGNDVVDAMRRLGRPAARAKVFAAIRELKFELKIGKQNGFYAVLQSGT